MLIEAIIFFLCLTVVFYVLFGGADFGAGILEMISGNRNRYTILNAIGPMWELNHIWLIFIVVILFVGFPDIYSTVILYLHIPLLIVFLGIIFRGIVFVLIHIDALNGKIKDVYNWTFKTLSIITPLFLGIILAAVILGRIDPNATTVYDRFIAPWLNLFSISVGLFTVVLFTFLANVYMIGETEDELEFRAFTSSAKSLNAISVATGIFVFTSAEFNGLPLFLMYLNSWPALGMVIFATVIIPILWWSLQAQKIIHSRVLAASQVIAILFAWFWVQMPVIIRQAGQDANITFYNTAAPDATLWKLFLALIIGSVITLLSLYYLMKGYKRSQYQ